MLCILKAPNCMQTASPNTQLTYKQGASTTWFKNATSTLGKGKLGLWDKHLSYEKCRGSVRVH